MEMTSLIPPDKITFNEGYFDNNKEVIGEFSSNFTFFE
jgi:hypothetical protein